MDNAQITFKILTDNLQQEIKIITIYLRKKLYINRFKIAMQNHSEEVYTFIVKKLNLIKIKFGLLIEIIKQQNYKSLNYLIYAEQNKLYLESIINIFCVYKMK